MGYDRPDEVHDQSGRGGDAEQRDSCQTGEQAGAPANFSPPSSGNQDRGTPTRAEFARTNCAGMKSGIAMAMVVTAVTATVTR